MSLFLCMLSFSLKGTTYAYFIGQFFRIFEIKLFCFVVAMSDVVDNVEAMHGQC